MLAVQPHDEISGVTDYREDEKEALNHIRTLVSHWGDLGPATFIAKPNGAQRPLPGCAPTPG